MELDGKTALYFISSIKKTLSTFQWGTNSFNEKILKNISFQLPITPSGEIDFDYMQKYIKAIQKLVIKSLVKWKEKEISKTKEVIGD